MDFITKYYNLKFLTYQYPLTTKIYTIDSFFLILAVNCSRYVSDKNYTCTKCEKTEKIQVFFIVLLILIGTSIYLLV